MHAAPVAHRTSHAPQWLAVVRSLHASPQSTSPLGHVHVPPTHVALGGQAFPHAPQ